MQHRREEDKWRCCLRGARLQHNGGEKKACSSSVACRKYGSGTTHGRKKCSGSVESKIASRRKEEGVVATSVAENTGAT
ncbi:uncharacterized protein DS421_8g248120 [Arachis hypogaea]|nr:uncharacterized protein DS421_8g248120 [Arachis hypogaea]